MEELELLKGKLEFERKQHEQVIAEYTTDEKSREKILRRITRIERRLGGR